MEFKHQPDTAVRPSDTIEFKALLLVDDDKQLASALQWILADENFLVDVANDGDEALLKVRANEYDAIVCDVMMPGTTGIDLYAKIRERSPRTADRIVFVTGGAFVPRVAEFLSSVDNPKLDKPLDVKALLRAVSEVRVRRGGGV